MMVVVALVLTLLLALVVLVMLIFLVMVIVDNGGIGACGVVVGVGGIDYCWC